MKWGQEAAGEGSAGRQVRGERAATGGTSPSRPGGGPAKPLPPRAQASRPSRCPRKEDSLLSMGPPPRQRASPAWRKVALMHRRSLGAARGRLVAHADESPTGRLPLLNFRDGVSLWGDVGGGGRRRRALTSCHTLRVSKRGGFGNRGVQTSGSPKGCQRAKT